MSDSLFDPNQQESNLSYKISTGLERISDAFKVMLLEKAKELGISPIQIQILIFMAHHPSKMNTVGHLAKEFNLTKATISDAVKTLESKKLVNKKQSVKDNRKFMLTLTRKGKTTVQNAESFIDPIQTIVSNLPEIEQERLFGTVSKLILGLHYLGQLPEQRICYSCSHFTSKDRAAYCAAFKIPLESSDIRIDCDKFITKA